jgi:NitT/TauT family transport system substrate-binding protein
LRPGAALRWEAVAEQEETLNRTINVSVVLAWMLIIGACGGGGTATTGTTGTTAPPQTSTTGASTTTPEETTTTIELTPATLRLDWTFLVYHMPFVYAHEQGYYAEEGIDLEILEGEGSGTTVTLVGTGDNTFGFADTGTTMVQKSQGVPVTNTLVIWRSAGFGTACFTEVGFSEPKDLEGRGVVLIPVESTAQIWPAYLAANEVDASQVEVLNADFSNKVSLFAAGETDCMAGVVGEDTLIAQLNNPDIADPVPWSDHGIQVMGHGIVVADETIAADPELVRGFVMATVRGWQEVCADPQIGIDLYLSKFPDLSEADIEFTERNLPYECGKMEPVGTDTGSVLGPTDDALWQSMIDLYTEFGGLENPLSPAEYYTNEFVP